MLHALLDDNLLRYGPEYDDGLSNHLPMAIHALHSLGAGPQRLQAFYNSYAPRLQRAVVAVLPAANDWLELRGQSGAYAALLDYFNVCVAAQGMRQTLGQAIPALLPGMSGAAFHGLIRTAHGWQAGHARELAAGLAYWAYRWQPLPTSADAGANLKLDSWAEHLIAHAHTWNGAGFNNISERMLAAAKSRLYQEWAGALEPASSVQVRIAQLAALAVSRYVACPNFTVLHLITGLRALRVLLPWVQDTEEVQAVLAHSFFAAYMAARVQAKDTPAVSAGLSWQEVIAAATASDNDHVIKLVHACREEASVYGEGLYLRAAGMQQFD